VIIDLHAHHIQPKMLDFDPFWGPRFAPDADGMQRMTIGKWQLTLGTKEAAAAHAAGGDSSPLEWMKAPNRLKQMDERGIDKAVMSVPAHAFMYHTGDFGTKWCRMVNDEFAEYCAQAPDRLFWWAPLPLQNPEEALKELDRAIKLGARGVNTGGVNLGGHEFHDEALLPVWKRCAELNVPVYVHGYNQSVGWEDPSKDMFETTSIVGFCYDETVAFWNLICGGVLDKVPDLTVCITHGGGFVPYQLGRFDATAGNLSDGLNKKPFLSYLDNFYFDPLIHDPFMRQAVIDSIGADRLLYGTNFNGSDQIRGYLLEGMKVSESDTDKICYQNASALLDISV
jgi:aminocarboxymuconate-semialdehyde decarboxylase